MEEKPKPDDVGSSMGAFEADLLGTVMQFYVRLIQSLRQSPLDEAGKRKVYERILPLMEELSSNIEGVISDPKGFDLKGRMVSIYKVAERTIEELGGGKQIDPSPDETE